MEVVGILLKVMDVQQHSETFMTREFVIETIEQYPQRIKLQLANQACDIIEAYRLKQEIKCFINLRGREWTNPQGEVVYFNTIQAWKIQPNGMAPQSSQTDKPAPQAQEPAANFTEEEHDDLPF